MPWVEAEDATELLFINAGGRMEQVERVEEYQAQTMCRLPMQQESKLQQKSGTPPLRSWIINPYWPIWSQRQIPEQSGLRSVWGAELMPKRGKQTEVGPGSALKTAHHIHRWSTGGCQSSREVTYKENQKFFASNYVKWKWVMVWLLWRGRELNWWCVCFEKEG